MLALPKDVRVCVYAYVYTRLRVKLIVRIYKISHCLVLWLGIVLYTAYAYRVLCVYKGIHLYLYIYMCQVNLFASS